MMRLSRYATRALLLSACILTATASAAMAAEYPPSQHKGSLSLPNGSSVGAGGAVAIAGTDCGSTADVNIAFDGTAMKTVTTDSSGAFSTSVGVPSGTAAGTHTVTASNANCELVADVTVTAAGDPASGTLPNTGSSGAMPAVFLAIGALLLGAALVVVTRRRMRRLSLTSKDA